MRELIFRICDQHCLLTRITAESSMPACAGAHALPAGAGHAAMYPSAHAPSAPAERRAAATGRATRMAYVSARGDGRAKGAARGERCAPYARYSDGISIALTLWARHPIVSHLCVCLRRSAPTITYVTTADATWTATATATPATRPTTARSDLSLCRTRREPSRARAQMRRRSRRAAELHSRDTARCDSEDIMRSRYMRAAVI